MKFKRLSVMVALLSFLISGVAEARTIKMIFWYPGEAGSTVEAQPVIDEFLKYINDKMAPDKIEGRYFNTTEEGLAYIKKEAPAVGILSYTIFTAEKEKVGNPQVLLATLPKPAGKSLEQYTLVGREKAFQAANPIFASEPLSGPFVNASLFTEIPAGAKIQQSRQLLAKLKEIGEGKLNAQAILTPAEAATLAHLSAPWAKTLVTIADSKPVPSARVVLFDASWKDSAKFKSALLSLGGDPKAKEILDEMRLAGFSEK